MTSSSILIPNAFLINHTSTKSRMHWLSFLLYKLNKKKKQRINHLIVKADRTEFRRTVIFLRTSERE